MLTDDDLLEIINLRAAKYTSRTIASQIGCSKSTVNNFLSQQTYKEFWDRIKEKPIAYGEIGSPEEKRKVLSGKKYVITSAQNNTYVHNDFLQSLQAYCEENDAELLISTFTYNKNGFQNSSKDDDDLWYDPKVKPYIYNESAKICDDLIFCGELNILPTAVNPLTGFNNYTGLASAIIPHAKVAMESVPTPKHDPAKLLYTTGAVTQRSYIAKAAGQKAAWHHVYGALVVEIDSDGDWFVRQLIADSDTGCFYDLNDYYTPSGSATGYNVTAINWGDIHVAKLDDEVADVSWRNQDSILDTLKPNYQFLHDVLDQQARNHHNVGNPHKAFSIYTQGKDDVREEVIETALEIKRTMRPWCEVIVVNSNHDDALEKWLREQDYRKDNVNSLFFLELQLAKYRAIAERDESFHTFEYAIKANVDGVDGVRFLALDESFRLFGDIEYGSHGHLGNNGARGSARAFAIQGVKAVIGHSHAAGIQQGVYIAGVSGNLDMGYNVGGSSWSHSHVITYNNGKRAIITLKKRNGKTKWRA